MGILMAGLIVSKINLSLVDISPVMTVVIGILSIVLVSGLLYFTAKSEEY